jgi:hypothetical protein
MKMLSATKLRESLYAVLDQVLKTGVPAIIERKGKRIRIVADIAPSRLERLERHDAIVGDAEEIVHLDWSSNWNGDKVLS